VSAKETPPVELIVERSEILEQIKAEFRFEREGVVMRAAQVAVVLTVQNSSDATIRFPQRGAMMEGVSLRIVRKEPAFHSDLFFPSEKLTKSTVIPDTYTWDVASEVPSVVLQPGNILNNAFCLKMPARAIKRETMKSDLQLCFRFWWVRKTVSTRICARLGSPLRPAQSLF